MRLIRALDRYEVDGKTILFVPKDFLSDEDLAAVKAGEQITFSARNEFVNSESQGRYLSRSIMIPKIEQEKDTAYFISVKLDIMSLPTTRRLQLDTQDFSSKSQK